MRIALCDRLKDRVLAVERKWNRVIKWRLEMDGEVLTFVRCFASQTGCTEEEKEL